MSSLPLFGKKKINGREGAVFYWNTFILGKTQNITYCKVNENSESVFTNMYIEINFWMLTMSL